MTSISSWFCLDPSCSAGGAGNWAESDRAAERHTRDHQHATTTRTVGSIRERDTDGTVHNRKPRKDQP